MLGSLKARVAQRRTLLVCAVAAYVALVALPDLPRPLVPGFDNSWIMGMSMAHAQELEPGKGIIWTYGPLGYLALPDPAFVSGVPALLFRLSICLVWAGALARLLLALESWTLVADVGFVFAAVGATFPATLPTGLVELLELAIVTVALIPFARRSRVSSLDWYVLAVLAGVAALVKTNLAVEAGGLLLVVLAIALYRSRPLTRSTKLHAAAALLACPLTALVLYVVVTGHLLSFWEYVRQSLEMASSYSEAQSQPGPLWQAALAVASLAALFAGLPLIAENARALAPGLIPAALVAYFLFKHGFVCQDLHAAPFQAKLALAALFPFVCAGAARDRRAVAVFLALTLFLGFCVVSEGYPGTPVEVVRHFKLEVARRSAAAYLDWPRWWRDLRARGEASLAPLRMGEHYQRLIGQGSVDAMPGNIAQVRANGWNWRPRPIFQSHSVQSAVLDRINARRILGSRAAEFVVLRWEPVRPRNLFFDDPLSWQALLNCYDLVLSSSQALLLERRATPRFGQPLPIGSARAHFDEPIEIPRRDGLVLMAVDIRPSVWGRLKNLLFRIDPIYYQAAYDSGEKVAGQVKRATLPGGVIINQLPRGLSEINSLLRSGAASQDRVRWVRFYTGGPAQYGPDISVRWSYLPWPPSAGVFQPPPESARVLLWSPGDAADQSSFSVDLGPSLGRFETLVVRARFKEAGRVSLSFGQEAEGRELEGYVPENDRWFDVYIHGGHNEFWNAGHGTRIRVDAASIRIAGIWGIAGPVPASAPDFQFVPAPPP